jgi:capsular polysaccharide transport system permease protein
MSNEDRIKVWRERRHAGIVPTDPQATALALAFSRASALVAEPVGSALDTLRVTLNALAAFPQADLGERREIFGRIAAGVEAGAKERGLSEATTDFWARRVILVTRAVEMDIRANVNVQADGYKPSRLEQLDAQHLARFRSLAQRERSQKSREQRRQATRDDVPYVLRLKPADAADLDRLRSLQTYLHATLKPHGVQIERVTTILPMFVLRMMLLQSESRIGILWTFGFPGIMATILSVGFFLAGLHFIVGMDAPSFSLSGLVVWYMFRVEVLRVGDSYHNARVFLNFEPIVPLAMSIITVMMYFLIYTGVFFFLVTTGHLFGLITWPHDVPGVILGLFGISVGSWALGVIFAAIASRWHYFLRLVSPIERFLQLSSGIFFISDQLPAEYKKFLLWNPMMHGFELLRKAYFVQYKATDASATYYITFLIVFVGLALLCDRLARPYVHPA